MKAKQPKTERWWQLSLLLIVCLFAGSSGAYAMQIITDSGMSYFDNQPTVSSPYIGIDLVYYEGEGEDTYFTHGKGDDVHAGPALYVDGKYICSPDEQLGWRKLYCLNRGDAFSPSRICHSFSVCSTLMFTG